MKESKGLYIVIKLSSYIILDIPRCVRLEKHPFNCSKIKYHKAPI